MNTIDPVRRKLLRLAAYGGGLAAASPFLAACADCPGDQATNDSETAFGSSGPLLEPDANGLRLPRGFRSRIVARSGEIAGNGNHPWHPAPDGGACFTHPEGGWVYVSNSEISNGGGGVSALRFGSSGEILGAYPILGGSNRNCAGGPTPWGTWLSCEEVPDGRVWECDPLGQEAATVHPALGIFEHEAAAVDPDTLQIYLTEDQHDGLFYRFTPATSSNGRPDLSNGTLEAAEIVGNGATGDVRWHVINDPQATMTPTRRQASKATPFARGEGAWYHDGKVFFCTTGDDRVYAYNIADERMELIYDVQCHGDRLLTGNDNITVAADGTLLIAEDGGNMQIVTIAPNGELAPLVMVEGHVQSEITGPAFSPDGKRLYFSSQRGSLGRNEDGVTYEILLPA